MGMSGGRGWMKVYEIYGVQEAGAVVGLIWQAIALTVATGFLFVYFSYCTRVLTSVARFVPAQAWGFVIGFLMGVMGLMAVCFFVTAANILYTNVILRNRLARRMVGMVEDWSKVESVLDVGCGRGLLLNTVALRLKKEGCGGRVVGVDLWLNGKKSGRSMASTLNTSKLEQTQEYVTCKSGDARNLPFTDQYFDAVVSALCLNNLDSPAVHRVSPMMANQSVTCTLWEFFIWTNSSFFPPTSSARIRTGGLLPQHLNELRTDLQSFFLGMDKPCCLETTLLISSLFLSERKRGRFCLIRRTD